MTPEKTTMAETAGGKRDRNSDDTDQPNVTPNSRDAKLSCWDAEGINNDEKGEETIENEGFEIDEQLQKEVDDKKESHKETPEINITLDIGKGVVDKPH
jgi:hypothetical protein